MAKSSTAERDTPAEKLKTTVGNMDLADKLMTNALVQMCLAFEVAKSSGKEKK